MFLPGIVGQGSHSLFGSDFPVYAIPFPGSGTVGVSFDGVVVVGILIFYDANVPQPSQLLIVKPHHASGFHRGLVLSPVPVPDHLADKPVHHPGTTRGRQTCLPVAPVDKCSTPGMPLGQSGGAKILGNLYTVIVACGLPDMELGGGNFNQALPYRLATSSAKTRK